MIGSGSTASGWSPSGALQGAGLAQTTGRFVVVFEEDEGDPGALLQSVAGLSAIAFSGDYDSTAMDMADTAGAEARVFTALGMAVVSLDSDQAAALTTAEDARGRVLAIAPELIHQVLPSGGYVEGYRDGVTDLVARVGGGGTETADVAAEASQAYVDDDEATWGLKATRVLASDATGEGIRVAVLDTGMDLKHPDFAGRSITSRSFISGQSVQDGHGHGTHCIGTACGPKTPSGAHRYGVAHEAEIFAGKVLSDQGSGDDSGILAGIEWALANECAVISMSLGANLNAPHPPYTVAGRRALRRGSLIIAAAGNNADRPSDPGFVGVPANSPEIMAVGALDNRLRLAWFSARSLPGRGGQLDIAGPGVDVYSSWPMPMRYNTISGTSMATPHVAGIAALWAQATGRRGLELWATLMKESRRLHRRSVDVGAGLALAPK